MRAVVNYTKTGPLAFVSHLDFQRLWQRMFRIAGIPLQLTQGYNPHPRMRFANPLPTGYQSEGELLEIFLKDSWRANELLMGLNDIAPQGMEIRAVTEVSPTLPKLTALVDAVEYQVGVPSSAEQIEVGSGVITNKKGQQVKLADYLLQHCRGNDGLTLLISVVEQRTIRPTDIVAALFPNLDVGKLVVTRTGILARSEKLGAQIPAGLRVLD